MADRLSIGENNFFQLFLRRLALPNARSPFLRMPNAAQMNKSVTIELQNVMQGKKSTKEALDAAAAEWNRIASKYQK